MKIVNFSELFTYFVTVVTCVRACSEPEGGFVDPTPAEIVNYSDHVVVGLVTEILRPDPMFGEMYGDSTYGAMVTVQCTYKGAPLPGRITIGGAGFVPGLCFSKDLEANREYVLFLNGKQGMDSFYEQQDLAVNKSQLMDFLGVCGLQAQPPMEKGMMIKRKACPPATQLDTCKTQGGNKLKQPETAHTDTKPVPADPAMESKGQSAVDDGDSGAQNVVTSISTILFSVFLIVTKYMIL